MFLFFLHLPFCFLLSSLSLQLFSKILNSLFIHLIIPNMQTSKAKKYFLVYFYLIISNKNHHMTEINICMCIQVWRRLKLDWCSLTIAQQQMTFFGLSAFSICSSSFAFLLFYILWFNSLIIWPTSALYVLLAAILSYFLQENEVIERLVFSYYYYYYE